MNKLYEGNTPHKWDLSNRILALLAMLRRWFLEEMVRVEQNPEMMEEWENDYLCLRGWAVIEERCFSRREWAALMCPLGQLSTSSEEYASLLQSLLVLRWAAQFESDMPVVVRGTSSFLPAEVYAQEDSVSITDEDANALLHRRTLPRSSQELHQARQETWQEMMKLLIDSAQPGFEDLFGYRRKFRDIECVSKKDLRVICSRFIGQLNALDWLLGIKQDWDEPYFAGYSGIGTQDPQIFIGEE